jgi:hypothetical protein
LRLFPKRDRFQGWIEYDDGPKETYLAEVGGSWVADDVAAERVNREYGERDADGNLKEPSTFTSASVRQWVGADEEFAAALKVARQMRAEARRLGTAPDSEPEPATPLPAGTHANFIPLEQMPSRDSGRRPVSREGVEPDPYADGSRLPPDSRAIPGTFGSLVDMFAALGGRRR